MSDATATTSYGTWCNHGDASAINVGQTAAAAAGDFTDDYDLDAVEAEYRTAINDAIAHTGVSLHGDEFYGPYGGDFDPYADADDDAYDGPGTALGQLIGTVDLYAILQRHDTTTTSADIATAARA